jgi:hypothetical protein
MTVIHLGPALPPGSSHLPADLASSLVATKSSAYLVLLRMEVAAFHPLPFDRKRLVSVALFLAFIGRASGDL